MKNIKKILKEENKFEAKRVKKSCSEQLKNCGRIKALRAHNLNILTLVIILMLGFVPVSLLLKTCEKLTKKLRRKNKICS